ncbi:MAG TPA: type II and III secretion system protein family protein [Polyangia bacterium]|nr:type II and III secretion system protein family protein [Polyangia bacterium]
MGLALLLARAAPSARAQEHGSPTVEMTVGSSRVIRVGAPVSRVAVAGRGIVDVEATPPDILEITARHAGRTEVTAWDKAGAAHNYAVRVVVAGEGLRERLRALFPGEKIDAQQAGGAIVVSGVVPDAPTAERIEKVAASLAGGGANAPAPVINLLQVLGTQQVQLEVRFAEVSRSALRQMGLNLWARTGTGTNDVVGGMLGPATQPGPGLAPPLSSDPTLAGQLQLPRGLPVVQSPLAGAFSLLFATSSQSDVPLSGALSLLSERGFAKTLAEPTLVALSGQEATFLAGGEFPIPLTQALGQVYVDFKKFGIQLRFTPFVLGDETIQLKLSASVSDVDYTVGVRLNQVTVPGLTTRESSTTVRLRDGQGFAIAGLLSDRMRSTVDKLPGLGDLPILGALFRSVSFRHDETELLVVITAHLVTPRPRGEHIPVPGEDEVSDPSDLELFLLGTDEAHHDAPAGKVGFVE